MRGKLKFLLLYFLSWVVLFEFTRLIFIIRQSEQIKQLTVKDILLPFFYGLRMDISAAAYILVPVCIFTILAVFFTFFTRTLIYKIYTATILFFVLLLATVDLEIYRQWGFRLDASPLKYLDSPREVWASVSYLPIGWYVIGFIVVYAICYIFFLRVIHQLNKSQQKEGIAACIIYLLFTGLLIIPIRGGLQLAPINQSSVYFSTNNFANQTAINTCWNFLQGLMKKTYSTYNPYNYFEPGKERRLIDSLYQTSDKYEQILNTQRPNIIFIVWESFTEKATHISIDSIEVTPYFNALKAEGIYFSNIYASGDRSNKGLPAIFSGYPAMPDGSIISLPSKSSKLATISGVLKQQGYTASFYYGGEPEFANIKSYLVHGEYDPIVSINDFEKKDLNSKWGAHDAVVMKRIARDLTNKKQPFFTGWFTLSSHEPFETNEPPVFKRQDVTTKFLNSLHYTDECIYHLVEYCKQQPWWENTLIIITADHGHPLPETGKKVDNFKIPLLWLGGALNRKGVVIDKCASQLDISSTLMKQLRLTGDPFPFSKNIFDSIAAPWAFFNFNNGFGFMQHDKKLIYDNVGKILIEQEGRVSIRDIEAGKALMQGVFQDYLEK